MKKANSKKATKPNNHKQSETEKKVMDAFVNAHTKRNTSDKDPMTAQLEGLGLLDPYCLDKIDEITTDEDELAILDTDAKPDNPDTFLVKSYEQDIEQTKTDFTVVVNPKNKGKAKCDKKHLVKRRQPILPKFETTVSPRTFIHLDLKKMSGKAFTKLSQKLNKANLEACEFPADKNEFTVTIKGTGLLNAKKKTPKTKMTGVAGKVKLAMDKKTKLLSKKLEKQLMIEINNHAPKQITDNLQELLTSQLEYYFSQNKKNRTKSSKKKVK